MKGVRPLRRGDEPGVWHSRDGRWVFTRNHADRPPQRWFVYRDVDEYPALNSGHESLREAVRWVDTYGSEDQ